MRGLKNLLGKLTTI